MNAGMHLLHVEIFCSKNGKMSHLYLILFEIFYCARAWEKATHRKYHMQKLNISIDTQSRQTIALNIKR